MSDDRHALRREVIRGLSARPRALPPKLFYDALGSKLFEAITYLPGYYLTACELEILRDHAGAIAADLGPGLALVELGSGQSTKVPLLLDALPDIAAYVPVDIDAETLQAAAGRLRDRFPGLRVHPVAADFTAPSWRLPAVREGAPVCVFYPGSTIGNQEPHEARAFLEGLGRWLQPGDTLLVGFDLEKDVAVLEAAYDDPVGVTAAFNRNALAHLNRVLGADFDPRRFEHLAFWNAERRCVEMHLRSATRQEVRLGGEVFAFEAGETIHTESSFKYTRDRFATLAAEAGLDEERFWTDRRGWFGLGLYRWRAPAAP